MDLTGKKFTIITTEYGKLYSILLPLKLSVIVYLWKKRYWFCQTWKVYKSGKNIMINTPIVTLIGGLR